MNSDDAQSYPTSSAEALQLSEGVGFELRPFEIARFKTPPQACNYLPKQIASMDYRAIIRIGDADYEGLLSRGWRRFGIYFFRPGCPACTRCESLRIDVARFAPTHSQRRAWNRNASLRLVVQEPTFSEEHVRLWSEYHRAMEHAKGWPKQTSSPSDYRETFVAPPFSFAREFLYYDDQRLVAVGLVDVLPESISSIYFFHDPAYRKRALGVYSILAEIDYARRLGLKHSYLGYWVKECASMSYKSQYAPHELLRGLPADEEPAIWAPPQTTALT